MSLQRRHKKIILISIPIVLILLWAGAYLLPKLSLIIPIKVNYSRIGAPRIYLLPVDRLLRVAEDKQVGGIRHAGAWFSFRTPFDIQKSFDSEHAQAFLFGNPTTAADVYVYLFNPFDRMFRMKFTSMTQGEIDFFLTSIEFSGPSNRTQAGWPSTVTHR